jgi:hypothetical protein
MPAATTTEVTMSPTSHATTTTTTTTATSGTVIAGGGGEGSGSDGDPFVQGIDEAVITCRGAIVSTTTTTAGIDPAICPLPLPPILHHSCDTIPTAATTE